MPVGEAARATFVGVPSPRDEGEDEKEVSEVALSVEPTELARLRALMTVAPVIRGTLVIVDASSGCPSGLPLTINGDDWGVDTENSLLPPSSSSSAPCRCRGVSAKRASASFCTSSKLPPIMAIRSSYDDTEPLLVPR